MCLCEENDLVKITDRSECFTKIISSIFQGVRYTYIDLREDRENAIFEFRRGNGNEGSENLERIDYGAG